MADPAAFVLPAGLQLRIDGAALSIAHPGDINLSSDPGIPLGDVRSEGGDVHLTPGDTLEVGAVEAPGGTVFVHGKVKSASIRARRIVLSGGRLDCEVLQGIEGVELKAGRVEASVIVAEAVHIDSKVKGRATAIQSKSSLGAHKLKGCFSLSEFVSLMPGAEELLQKHGIDVPEEDDEEEDLDSGTFDAATPEPALDPAPAPVAAPAPAPITEPKFAAEPVAKPEFVAGPAPSPEPAAPPEVVKGVAEALERIRGAYDEELPPPIGALSQLVAAGDYAGLKKQINVIWSDLLKHHQKTGLYISNTVTHMFQTLQLLMRKLD